MLKIKQLDFNKTTFDVSPTHHVFSIASVYFTNADAIHGAILYWQENTTDGDYTDEGDYKFYYEMADTQFFASVRFPDSITLSKEQQKELAFILLEERGSIGSYSVESSKVTLERLQLKKQLARLVFPAHFDAADFSPFATEATASLLTKYEPAFIQDYLIWRQQAALFHPEDIASYLPKIGIGYLCYVNAHLSELFLIEHLPSVDFQALQHNHIVIERLSTPFKQHILMRLQQAGLTPITTFTSNLEQHYVEEATEEEVQPLDYFEYERLLFEWPGAEHMVKGIPSLESQLYDAQHFKKRLNNEMDTLFYGFSPLQIHLFSAIAELHWLQRYRDWIDWSSASRYNPHLSDTFLLELDAYIVTEQLVLNKYCRVSEKYLIAHMEHFKHYHPAPLILSHLTARIYRLFKQDLQISLDLLYDYYDYIDQQDFEVIFDLLSEEQAR